MDINLDTPPWLEAANKFFRSVEERFEAPRDKEVLLGDALSCDLFAVFVSKRGAETDIIIRVVKSEAKDTHPAV